MIDVKNLNHNNATPDTLLLEYFKECNPLTYKQIAHKCFGGSVNKKQVNKLVNSIRKMGYKIQPIANYGFMFYGRRIVERSKK